MSAFVTHLFNSLDLTSILKEALCQGKYSPDFQTVFRALDAPLDTRHAVEVADCLHSTRLPAAICYPSQASMKMRRRQKRVHRNRPHRLPSRPRKPTRGINTWRSLASQNTDVLTFLLGKRKPAVSVGTNDILLRDT